MRRGPRRLRCSLEELAGGDEPAARLLPRLVPGAADATEAARRIAAATGSLPVPRAAVAAHLAEFERRFPDAARALIARAERACRGQWDLLGAERVELGIHPDWQLDFRSGRRWEAGLHHRRIRVAPGGGADIKVPWELSRLQHLPAVAHAFRLAQEPRFAELVATQLEDWIARNPAGRGANWSCAMEVALRGVSMSWAFELCREAPPVAALAPLVYASLWAHGRFLETHLEDDGVVVGNHYVADLLGLCWLGALYPALSGSRHWAEKGRRRLLAHLSRQVRPDGGDCESSIPYHRLVLEMVGLAAQILDANGLGSAELTATASRMAAFTAAILQPDGSAPQLGDNDGGRAFRLLDRPPNEHRYLLSWIALLSGSSALAGQAPLDPEAFLLSAPEAAGRHVPPVAAAPCPAGEAIRLPDSGLCVACRGDFYVLLAAAPVGQAGAGGHGHNDKLALEIYLGGALVADPGSFVYTADPAARNRYRSTAAHATVQVDGREQNPLSARDLFFLPERAHARVLRWSREGDLCVWEAEQRGFVPLVHRRHASVDLGRRTVEIEDQLLGDGVHEVAARFPLAPGTTARALDAGTVRLERPAAPPVDLSATGPAGLTVAIEESRYSPTYGAERPSHRVTWRVRAPLPCTLRFRFTAPIG